MTTDMWEHAARRFEPPPPPRWARPGLLAEAVDTTTIHTPALDLIDEHLVKVESGEIDRLIITMSPQEGKSTRVTKTGPLWFLERNPDLRIAIASYAQSLADEFGRDIRSKITSHDGTDGTLDLGLRIAADNGAVSAWKIDGHRGGVRSVGVGSGLTGHPVDLLFVDDPIKDLEQAESEVYRERVWNAWTGTWRPRLAPGAPVVVILTRWHHDDLVGRLLKDEPGRWVILNIPAQADHRPEKGETDPLCREPGEYMISARINPKTGKPRALDEWEGLKRDVGSRVWTSLYQGRPSPDEGNLFPRDGWARYGQPMHVEHADGTCWIPGFQVGDMELVQSWDLTFKDTKGSDFVVGQVWLRIGVQAFLLDQVRGRWDFVETCRRIEALSKRWPQALAKFVEDKANGPAVIAALRLKVAGLIPIEPEGSKYARASAISPAVEAHNVVIPTVELAPWVDDLVEEHAAFPAGAHDDQVDGTSQAINRLLLQPLPEDDVVEPAEFSQLDELGWSIAPH